MPIVLFCNSIPLYLIGDQLREDTLWDADIKFLDRAKINNHVCSAVAEILFKNLFSPINENIFIFFFAWVISM